MCGSMSGAVAAAVTTPLDVIKTRLMLGAVSEYERERVCVWGAFVFECMYVCMLYLCVCWLNASLGGCVCGRGGWSVRV